MLRKTNTSQIPGGRESRDGQADQEGHLSRYSPFAPAQIFAQISVIMLRYRDAEPKSRRRAAEREMEWEERPEGREGLAGQEARADSTPLRTLRHLVGPSVPEMSPCRVYRYT
jgi:hypothetical protein